jgi:hypothetical protein
MYMMAQGAYNEHKNNNPRARGPDNRLDTTAKDLEEAEYLVGCLTQLVEALAAGYDVLRRTVYTMERAQGSPHSR